MSLLAERRGAVAVLTLDRPEVRNAIDDALQSALVAELDRIAADRSVRALVVTGAGKAFCSGGDITGMQARLSDPAGPVVAGWRRLAATQRLITTLQDLGVVTIAAVNGPAVGIGFDLALACDFVLVADTAFFATAFIERGLVPDGGGMHTLPRRVGLARAKELVFSGRRVPADEAVELGIADRALPAAELVDAAVALADEYAQRSPTAIALAKAILNRSFESTREEVFARSAAAQAICYSTEEHRSSVEAFLNTNAQPGGQ